MCNFPNLGHFLSIEDMGMVFYELYEAFTKWCNIGLKLGMSYMYNDLQAIKQRHRDDPDECFKDVL